jgi:hypothetical protein
MHGKNVSRRLQGEVTEEEQKGLHACSEWVSKCTTPRIMACAHHRLILAAAPHRSFCRYRKDIDSLATCYSLSFSDMQMIQGKRVMVPVPATESSRCISIVRACLHVLLLLWPSWKTWEQQWKRMGEPRLPEFSGLFGSRPSFDRSKFGKCDSYENMTLNLKA